ncbi:MAG: hypothetical protein NUV93_03420 [Firmicutes bacterium]|jgi:hypothetical protein|nr:hypothetical protein [Bacillota bacterium]
MAEERNRLIESALLRVKDILYVKTALDREGNVESIHVLARSSRSAAKISRDIQSVLSAQFGLEVDPSKISVAQIAGQLETVIPPLRPRLRSVWYGVEGNEARAKVTLEVEGKCIEGTAAGGCSRSNRLRLVANATLDAVNSYVGDVLECELEDALSVVLSGQPTIVVTVRVSSAQRSESLTGSCMVRRDDLEAIARATLDSLNRRLPFHLKGENR